MTIARSVVILFFSISVCLACAQPSIDLMYSFEIESRTAEGSLRPSRAGALYSFIGDYANAIQCSDIPVSWGIDTLDVTQYEITAALPVIISEAGNHQVVIISENHLKPQHRIFARHLIEALSKEGFTYLGLESLTPSANDINLMDSNLVNRGYPLDSPQTGYYMSEPQMGNLVRRALELNYSLFAYERHAKVENKDRDEVQAENIARVLSDDPNAKIIIVCGFHHTIESELIKRGNSYWMAKYLKDKTGLDPLTIYQDNFTEKVITNEHKFLHECPVQEPSVFIDGQGNVVRLTENVDIEVIHPRTFYRMGRPSWLYETKKHRAVSVRTSGSRMNYPMMVSAILAGEEGGVPIDRIELKHKYDIKHLVLPPGEYEICLADGQREFWYTEKVY